MGIQQTSGKVLRYRIEVMALAADDVVANLGGVLFDRRGLGWDTMVMLDDRNDIRPLQIIGADSTDDLQSTLDLPQQPHPVAIATSVQLYLSDLRVCARINAAIDSQSAEVLLWGDANAMRPNRHLIVVEHRISRAAATFKTQALTAAAGATPSTDLEVERFLATRAMWQTPHTQRLSTVNTR